MAESIEDFYIRLGLTLSELESGFIEANRTISANISRLNRESDLIRIRSEVEIAGLDEAADAERILQVRADALNQQMQIQRDRIHLANAELRNLTSTYGENHVVTQRATERLERARLALARMEQQTRNLTSAQNANNESNVRFFANIGDGLSGVLHMDFTDVLSRMPPQLQAVAKGIGSIAVGAGTAAKSVQALLTDFKELEKQSYELNMSVKKTRDFLLQLRLGGGDIGDFEGYIRGITDAWVKGEVDDPEFIALSKYGAKITDASGRLKEFADIVDEVYRAFKKADKAGEAIEFLQLTGGESGIRDAIQFFKRYEEAQADAQKLIKAEIDQTQLHELDRTMNLVSEQARELKDALGDIFVPAAQTAAENFFEILRTGTEILKDSKNAIQSSGFIVSETFSTIGKEIDNAFSAIGDKLFKANEKLNEKTEKTLNNMTWRYGGIKKPVYGLDAMIKGQVEKTSKSFGVLEGIIERAKQNQEEYNSELKKTAENFADLEKKIDKNPLSQYALQWIIVNKVDKKLERGEKFRFKIIRGKKIDSRMRTIRIVKSVNILKQGNL